LRPGGILLDLHPEPEHNRIQVHASGRVHDIGLLDDTAYIRDVHAGREVVDSLVRAGLFTREREVVFEHVAHASDVEAWLSHRAEAGSRSILDPQIVERARALLAEGDGEILVIGRGYAARLGRP
jgi:hypothetical protein